MIVLLLSIAAFGILLDQNSFRPCATLILQQVAIVGIVGAAQSLVILTAGIDLSVGAIMVLSSVVMGQFTFRYGLPVELRSPLAWHVEPFVATSTGFWLLLCVYRHLS